MRIKFIIITIITIIILILFTLLLIIGTNRKVNKKIKVNIDKSKQTIIPKKIWTYWHDQSLPDTINKCIENWRKYNPEYDIVILNNSNYKEYINGCDILDYPASRFHARVADFMRIHVLNQNGGIWLDASTILHESLDWVLKNYDEQRYEFIGFHIVSKETKPEYPVIENWFMASPKGSEFIQKWLEKFLESNKFQSDFEYLLYIESLGVDLQDLSRTGYLTMHYAVQYVLQKEMSTNEIKTKLYLEKAEDGPFKYLHENGWNHIKSIKALCANKELRTKVVKFRKYDRKAIEDNKLFCVFNNI
jgi:hypothetical protein